MVCSSRQADASIQIYPLHSRGCHHRPSFNVWSQSFNLKNKTKKKLNNKKFHNTNEFTCDFIAFHSVHCFEELLIFWFFKIIFVSIFFPLNFVKLIYFFTCFDFMPNKENSNGIWNFPIPIYRLCYHRLRAIIWWILFIGHATNLNLNYLLYLIFCFSQLYMMIW